MIIPRAGHDYMTKACKYDFSAAKPRSTLDTDIKEHQRHSKSPCLTFAFAFSATFSRCSI